MAPVPQAATSRELLSLYRTLTATRTAEPALRRGGVRRPLHPQRRPHDLVPPLDSGEARDAIVALNSDVVAHKVHVPMRGVATDGTAFVDALDGARYVVAGGALDLPSVHGNFGAVLLRQATTA